MRCRFGEWNLKDVDFLNQVQLITAKPVVYLVNLPEKMYIKKKSKWLPKVPAGYCFLLTDLGWHATPKLPSISPKYYTRISCALTWIVRNLKPRDILLCLQCANLQRAVVRSCPSN